MMAMVVIMAAMFVMDVTMIVLAMRMTVTVVIMAATVMAVAVAVIVMGMIMTGVRLMRGGIGTAFGIERRLDLDDARAETLHHVLDDMIAANAQALCHDLRRQVAIAEMPGEPHQMAGICAAYLDQRLGRCDHLDTTAIFQHQGVAAAQGDGVFQIEQEFQSARPRHHHATTMTIVEVENDGVDGRFNPVVLANNGCRADHVFLSSTKEAVIMESICHEAIQALLLAVWTASPKRIGVANSSALAMTTHINAPRHRPG